MTDELEQDRLIPDEPLQMRDFSAPVDQIRDSGAGPSASRALIESIRELGILYPVILTQDTDAGVYDVIAGRRRVRAARTLYFEDPETYPQSVPARLVTNPTSVDIAALADHATRKSNEVVDLEIIERLFGEGYSEKEIARATHLSTSTLRKRMKLKNLDSELRDLAKEGAIAPSVASQAAGLSPNQQKDLISTYTANGKITAADVREQNSVRKETTLAQTFEGLEPPEPEPAPATPQDGHEYAQALARVLVDSGFAEDVEVSDPGTRDASLRITHADGASRRIRIPAPGKHKKKGE